MGWEDDYEYDDGVERGGGCAECGEQVEQDHWEYCSSCYSEMNGWKRPARPEPGTQPVSFIEGLTKLRETVARQEVRIAYLEQQLRRAA